MQQSSIAVLTRKVFSSNLAHLSLVFFWISGMHFHGAYFSNYDIWLKDPKHYLPSAHNVWSLIGQDILNSDIGNYFQGIHITSGIFQLQLYLALDLIFICISLGPHYWLLVIIGLAIIGYYWLLFIQLLLLQEIQVFIHSSFICLIWVEFYKLVWASNSHFGTT